MKKEKVIELVTDHFQVLFGDELQAPLVDTTALWDAPGRVVAMAGVSELVGLGTIRYGGTTHLTIRIDDYQEIPTSDWQMLGSFEVNVPSGRMIFWAPEVEDINLAPRVELSPGRYRGSAFSRGEEGVHDEMDSSGPDEYLIVLAR